jgi:hypothetical protein
LPCSASVHAESRPVTAATEYFLHINKMSRGVGVTVTEQNKTDSVLAALGGVCRPYRPPGLGLGARSRSRDDENYWRRFSVSWGNQDNDRWISI